MSNAAPDAQSDPKGNSQSGAAPGAVSHAASPPAPPPPLPPNHAARASFFGGRLFSLRAALNGAWHTLRTQPNAWIELAALTVVALVAAWLRITPMEWALLGLTAFLVLALEAVNTAIEAVVDLVSPQYHPLARTAKDAAAGALIFAVLGSLVVAAAILLPRLLAR